jgi:hypothetical protein
MKKLLISAYFSMLFFDIMLFSTNIFLRKCQRNSFLKLRSESKTIYKQIKNLA